MLEPLDDVQGTPVDTRHPVAGGVTPLTLQAECGFHAYAQVRLAAEELEQPAPGLDARERGMLLHKALELVWIKLKDHFHLKQSEGLRRPRSRIRSKPRSHPCSAAMCRPSCGWPWSEKFRLEKLIESLLQTEQARPSFDVVALEARREVSIAGGRFDIRIDRIDSIEGGGFAILDYKSGEPRAPRWRGTEIRDPQLLSYLLAEAGRNVQALANVSLANNQARFSGKSSRSGLLPGVKGLPGMDPKKVPAEEIDSAWHGELERWLLGPRNRHWTTSAAVRPYSRRRTICRPRVISPCCAAAWSSRARISPAGTIERRRHATDLAATGARARAGRRTSSSSRPRGMERPVLTQRYLKC